MAQALSALQQGSWGPGSWTVLLHRTSIATCNVHLQAPWRCLLLSATGRSAAAMSTSSIVLHHSSYIQQPEWVTATLHRQLCGSTHVRQCNVKIYYASRKEKKRLHLLASIQ